MATIIKSIGGGEIIGTIVPNNSRFGMTNGYKIIEYNGNQDESTNNLK